MDGQSHGLKLAKHQLSNKARRSAQRIACDGTRITNDTSSLLGPGKGLKGGEISDQENITAETGSSWMINLICPGAQCQLQVASGHGHTIKRFFL